MRNALHNSGAWVITAVVTMLATPYIVFALGAEGYGVYILLTGLVGYYALFDLALGQGLVKFVAEYNAAGDEYGIAASLNVGLSLQIVAGMAGSILLAAGADLVLALFNVPGSLLQSAKISLYLCSAGFFVSMIGGTLNSVLMGLQRYDISSKINAASNSATVITTVLVLLAGGGLTGAVAVAVISSFVTCAVYYYSTRRFLKTWRFALTLRGPVVRSVTHFSSYLFLSRISDITNNYLGRFLIGYLLGPVAVTVYSVPAKLLNATWGLLGSGFGVLFPFASEMGVADNSELRARVFLKGSRFFAAVMLPALALLFAFSYPILKIWMGEEFARNAWPVLSILSLSSILASGTTIPIQLVLGWGHSKVVGVFSLGTVVTYLAALVLLSPLWGIIGTAFALVIATIPGLFLVLVLLRRVVRIGVVSYIGAVYKYHLLGVISAGVVLLAHDSVASLPTGLLVLIMATFMAIYVAMLWAAGWLPVGEIVKHILPDERELQEQEQSSRT